MFWLAELCILASGWRRIVIATVAGALGALAMPPVGFLPALIVSVTVAVWMIDGTTGVSDRESRATLQACRQAAVVGWWWGFGYHVAGLWWVGAAFLVEPDKFAWLLPLGVLGLPAGLAIFSAVGFAAARLLWARGTVRVFALVVGLCLSEYLRGTLFTGFPWNEIGMSLGQNLQFAQAASIVGQHGLTLAAIFFAALPACAVDLGGLRKHFAVWPIVACVGGFGLVFVFGAFRLHFAGAETVSGVRLRIMQTNIPQDSRYRGEAGLDLVRQYLELSDRATSPATTGLKDVTHLIWPESPFPFPIASEPRALAMIGFALGSGTTLLTGGVRFEPSSPGKFDAYNALFVVGKEGRILDTYEKAHLVPFGEYLPFSEMLRRIGLRQFVALPGGFESGPRRRILNVAGLPPVEPLICYEAIFPGEVMPQDANAPRPGVFINITNDAWFGATSGPYQHFAQARLRAVEEGIPLIRSANSGISAIVDGYGRILLQLPLGTVGVLDSALPKALPETIFGKYANIPGYLLWVFFLLVNLCLRRGSVRPRNFVLSSFILY